MTGAGAYLGGWVYTPVPFPHPYPSHPCGPGDNGCGGCGWERVRVRVHPYPPAALLGRPDDLNQYHACVAGEAAPWVSALGMFHPLAGNKTNSNSNSNSDLTLHVS